MDQLGHIYVAETDLYLEGGKKAVFFWNHIIHMGKTKQVFFNACRCVHHNASWMIHSIGRNYLVSVLWVTP